MSSILLDVFMLRVTFMVIWILYQLNAPLESSPLV